MLRLKFDPASASMQLAIDEAMLQWADGVVERRSDGQADPRRDSESSPHQSTELFRVWKFAQPTVVLGRSSKIDEEVDREFCQFRGIEVLRRCTGGASVVGGPGCLMYSVVIATPGEGGLRKIDVAHDFVMQRVLSAVQDQIPEATRLGICDLTLGEKKFSGNSLRVARHHLLYHGTILMSADLSLIAACLDHAPRQPEYRRGRGHGEFVTNVNLDEAKLTESLCRAFEVRPFDARPFDARDGEDSDLLANIEAIAADLMNQRYGDPAWHERR
ncbi:lipoate--protein ligase family protein [Neorhodopirellula pilleata]|uniref:Lipoate-protein ligase LplJ n=1 Tax=Neorhodopirellula pilleata TaxID=2714738 RepID=A0A5C6AG16_9BACT|nr:lipoate--protein ligase family protein [Neorhodopirellula pilleata]TWT98914.1 Lipoate-protein ligase LplJ [Neorhodopirellula pilleata]